jgi:hypothetical protein
MRIGLVLLLLMVGPPVVAQKSLVSETARAREESAALPLLRSPDTCTRAWGAYFVGKYGLQEHGAELVSELERLQPSIDSGELGYGTTSWLVQTVLDALIKIRHPVDPSLLLPFRRRWGPEVLILLLARDAQANRETWFSLLSEDLPCEQWLAASNLLASMRPPGFAEKLLSGAQFRLQVFVTDKAGGMGGGFGGSVYGDGLPMSPPGCPPAAVYRLSTYAGPEFVMLAPGPTPVYYWRRSIPGPLLTGDGYGHGDGAACDKQKGIQGHLAKFADYTPEQTRNVFEPSLYLVWQNGEDYTSKVKEALSSQAKWIQWMVSKLTGSRLLTPEERSGLRLAIQIQPVDRRAGGDPLPPTEAFPVKFE